MWMDLEMIRLSEVSQKGKDKHHRLPLTCGIWSTNQPVKQKRTVVAKRGGGRREGLGVWGQWMQTLTYRTEKQQGPTAHPRELYSVSCDKPEWKRVWTRLSVCVTESCCCAGESNTKWKQRWVKWKSLSRVWLSATPWAAQSIEFSRPDYWSG